MNKEEIFSKACALVADLNEIELAMPEVEVDALTILLERMRLIAQESKTSEDLDALETRLTHELTQHKWTLGQITLLTGGVTVFSDFRQFLELVKTG